MSFLFSGPGVLCGLFGGLFRTNNWWCSVNYVLQDAFPLYKYYHPGYLLYLIFLPDKQIRMGLVTLLTVYILSLFLL